MATTEVGGSSSSRGESRDEGGGSGSRVRHVLKKGPWTEAEDAELLNYVKKHGEGNWNVVHKNSGLRRCGKSCRLRWANHLRPNLKKGPFSPEEEEIIFKLHAKYGNKWASMASQLDGRTDNEIKNYWNTKQKKRQRTGLRPLYPVQQHTPATSISSSSSLTYIFPASASSSSQQNTDTCTDNPVAISPLNYPPYRNNTTNNPFSFFSRRYNPSFSFPSIATSSMPFFHQSLSANSLPLEAISLNTGLSMSATRATSFDPVGVFNMNTSTTGISCIGSQPLVPQPSTAQTSSGNTGSEGGILGGASSSTSEYDHIETANNSGLLEDLLEQSRTIPRLEKLNKDIVREDHELLDQNSLDDFNVGLSHGNPNPEVYLLDTMATHSDIGMNEKNEILEADMNVRDDDLMRLLECPSPMSIPDWYDDVVATPNYSNGQIPSNVEGNVDITNDDQRQISISTLWQ